MSAFDAHRLASRGLRHFRRSHTPAALGVAVATAVLTGALVVGDSVRGSLRGLTLERLGRYDHAVAPGRLFRTGLAEELAATEGYANHFDHAEPVLSLPASLGARVDGQSRRASGVTLHGVRPGFWNGSRVTPTGEDLLLTETVAEDLGVAVGDELIVRVGTVSAMPADSPLGEKADTTESVRVKVGAVLPDKGISRFGLRPSQRPPRNAFLPIERVQRLLDKLDRCNTLLLVSRDGDAADSTTWLTEQLSLLPADYGLTMEEVRPGVWQVESEQLVLPERVVEAARDAFGVDSVETVTTYLANTIRLGDRSVPYSTVAGVGLAPSIDRRLAHDEVVLNRWAADDLGAAVGDDVTLTFYKPESTHGVLREAAPVTLRLAAVAELTDENGPTAAADPRLTPRLPGVTDARAIGDWDLPFELVEPIRQQDEDYWDEYSTTPKAFVAEDLARRLWATRWGKTSLVRIKTDAGLEKVTGDLLAKLDPAEFGFRPLAIRRDGLAAASGSTPFDVLFLLFSLFLIASATMLITLLVRLAIDARAREVGLYGAIGWSPRLVRRQVLREQMTVVGVGAVAGVVLGVAYAALLLYLLRTVWIDAIVTPFLSLHCKPASLTIGAIAGVVLGWLTARAATRRSAITPPRVLLSGGGASASSASRATPWWKIALCLLVVIAASVIGSGQSGEAAAGSFFAAGAGTLAAAVVTLRRWFACPTSDDARLNLSRLGMRNITRNAGRSLLIVGLVSTASFLVLATGAFRLPPTEAGIGGFDLVAQTDTPVYYDLATEEGRFELGLGGKEERLMAGASVFGFRVHAGEDASCQNLYQATQPRVLGVPKRFVGAFDAPQRKGFQWAAHAEGFSANPWRALLQSSGDKSAIPVVIDFNTAVYALKLGGVGSRTTIRDEAGNEVTVEVAGLMKNSVLQGDLLMGEADFLRLYPSASGSSFFLIGGVDEAGAVAAALEDRLSDLGFDAEDARERLAGFLAVQNTYLSTFQALGALGLMLGAVGLAVAQFRNLAERRGELALMRAGGFSAARLRRLVLTENALLLAWGLGIGAISAAVSLLPLAAAEGPRPPWAIVGALVGGTALVGLLAARLAAGRTLAAPITPALRGD